MATLFLVNFQTARSTNSFPLAISVTGHSRQDQQHCMDAVEQYARVVLQICVVAARQPFQRSEKSCKVTYCASTGTASEFQSVRISLLWHHARTGRERVAELNASKLARAVNNQVLSQPRDVGRHHCHGKQQLGDEITVAYCVNTVLGQ